MLPRMNDYFPRWPLGGGVFSILQKYAPEVPWLGDQGAALSLDNLYHGSRPYKLSSPYLEVSKEPELALSISKMFYPSWGRLWDALQEEYNAIKPYVMDTTIDVTEESSGTDDVTITAKGNNSSTQNNNSHSETGGTDTLDHQGGGTVSTQYGERTESEDKTLTKTGSETHSTSGTTTSKPAAYLEDVSDNYPSANPFTVTVTDEGTERNTEKGGTVHSVWGFDSQSAVRSDQSIATGGDGEGPGNGDGSVPGDGHVTDTTFINRSHSTVTTGTRHTITDHSFTDDGKEVSQGSDSLTYDARKDTENTSKNFGEHTDIQTTDKHATDTTTYGKTVTETGGRTTTDLIDETHTTKGTNSGRNTTKNVASRKGNVGPSTTQTLLQHEYELRKRHFFDNVFADLDRLLTLPIYESTGLTPEGEC